MVRTFAIAALTLAAACGPNRDNVEWVRTERVEPIADLGVADMSPVSVDVGGLENWDLSGAGPLTGIFALEVILKAEAIIELESRQLLRLRVLQEGDFIRQRATLCDLVFPSLPGIAELSIPPALSALLRAQAIEVEGVFLDDDMAVGATYAPRLEPLVVGAELADPRADPLPMEADDSTVIDDDEDGAPGVSIGVDVVVCDQPEQMWVALRLFNELTGTVEDMDTIAGSVVPQLDQSVLGMSHECVAPAASIQVDLVEGSSFRALRVDDRDADADGNVSCAEISALAPELFGDFWAGE